MMANNISVAVMEQGWHCLLTHDTYREFPFPLTVSEDKEICVSHLNKFAETPDE